MSIFGASTTARTFPRVGKGFMIAALGGALALAAVAGIGIRQATQEDSAGGAAATTRPAEPTGISDQEAYQVWQQGAATRPAETAALSDQEAYQRWQRRTAAGEERIDTMGGVAGWRDMEEHTASSGSAPIMSDDERIRQEAELNRPLDLDYGP